MKSFATQRFWECYSNLPPEIRKKAGETYSLFSNDPYHPSLHFKRIHSTRPIFSVRITIDYRAVGVLEKDAITWFWIGSHKAYDMLIKRVRSA
ncbi:MAG: hypothetical protein ACOZBW_03660 [Thermodesulfobacteriota bacterium]